MAILSIEFEGGIAAERSVEDIKALKVIEQYLRTVGGDKEYENASNQQRLDALLKFTIHHWQLVAQHGKRKSQEAKVEAQWQAELDELELVLPHELVPEETLSTESE